MNDELNAPELIRKCQKLDALASKLEVNRSQLIQKIADGDFEIVKHG